MLNDSVPGGPSVTAQRQRDRHVVLDRGPVDIDALVGDPTQCFGLVVLEGLMVVELAVARANAAWLIGAEDIIRPWDLEQLSILRGAQWRVLQTVRLLRLERGFYERARHDPAAVQALVGGMARTTHWLFAKSLIISSPVVEERLLLMFALFGERWGKVTADGVLLHLPLTHELLAGLCGARRPSVTHALRSLERQGLVSCPGRGAWLLHRQGSEDEVGCWEHYARALGFESSALGVAG